MADNPRAPKRAKLLNASEADKVPDVSGSVIAVRVGKALRYVHESVLTASSEFFKRAMKSEWRTGIATATPIDLSDEPLDTFDVYCRWLYSQKLILDPCSSDSYNELVLLHVFGEHIMDSTFQDAVMDTIIGRALDTKTFPGPFSVKLIYASTASGSLLRRLAVDFWAYKARSQWEVVSNITAKTCVEFVDDLIPALLQHRERSKATVPWAAQREQYHRRTTNSPDDSSTNQNYSKLGAGTTGTAQELEE